MKKMIGAVAIAAITMVGSVHATHYCLPYEVEKSPFSTYIAQRVGDLLTVEVVERARTVDDGRGDLKRESSLFAELKQLFIPPIDIQDGLTRTAGTGDPAKIDLKTRSDYKSLATNTANHEFITNIQVRIIEEVRPNEFLVRGHRDVNINGKSKKIYLAGIIRQRDIESDNTIISTKLADAVIEIEGEVAKEDLKPGIFTRMFNKIF